MKVRYKAWRQGGEDWTGKVVDLEPEHAKTLIEANIVVPVEPEIPLSEETGPETAVVEPPENAMQKPPVKKTGTKRSNPKR